MQLDPWCNVAWQVHDNGLELCWNHIVFGMLKNLNEDSPHKGDREKNEENFDMDEEGC